MWRRFVVLLLALVAVGCHPKAGHTVFGLSASAAISIADGAGNPVNQANGQTQQIGSGDIATFALQSTAGVSYPVNWVIAFTSPNSGMINGKSFYWDGTSGNATFSLLMPPAGFTGRYVSTIYDANKNPLSQYVGTITNTGSAGGGGGASVAPNAYWNRTAWFIDPSNSTGCASDVNDGSSSTCPDGGVGGPVLHWQQIVNLWGTYSPQQPHADVTFTLMSSQLDNNDPVIFRPIMLPGPDGSAAGNTYLFTCSKSLSSTTTVSTVQQKVTTTNASPTFFQVTFGTAPTRGQMIQNTTHSSIAFVGNYNSTSQLTQPLSPSTSSGTGLPIGIPSEVNTWATSDAISLYNLPQWTFSEIRPTAVGLAGLNVVIVQNCWIQEQNAIFVQPGDDKFTVGDGVQIVESFVERDVVSVATSESYTCSSGIINSELAGGFHGGTTVSTPPSLTSKTCPYMIVGGGVTNQNTSGVGASTLANVEVMHGTGFHTHSGGGTGFPFLFQGYNYLGEVVTWASQDILQPVAGGVIDLRNLNAAVEAGNVWGNGKLNPTGGGQVLYNATGIDAGALAITTLQLNGGTTGCCMTNAAPATVECGQTINPTNLGVTTCSTAGLNNQAFAPTGGGFQGF